ncbi:MAG: O-antigen/teichoic acid export membrane protein [Polaribacter sp.]
MLSTAQGWGADMLKPLSVIAYAGVRGGFSIGVLALFYLVSSGWGEQFFSRFSLAWAACFVLSILIRGGSDVGNLKYSSVENLVRSLAYLRISFLKISLRFLVSLLFVGPVCLYYGVDWFFVVPLLYLFSVGPVFSFYLRGRGHKYKSAALEFGAIAWLLGLVIFLGGKDAFPLYSFIVLSCVSAPAFLVMLLSGFDDEAYRDFEGAITLRRDITKSQLLNSLQSWGVLLITPLFMTSKEIALFAIYGRLVQVPNILLQSLNIMVAPKYSKLSVEGAGAEIVRLWRTVSLLGCGLVFPVMLLVFLFLNSVLGFFSIAYSGVDFYYASFLIMVMGQILIALSGGGLMLLNITGRSDFGYRVLKRAVFFQALSALIVGFFVSGILGVSVSVFIFNATVLVMVYSAVRKY